MKKLFLLAALLAIIKCHAQNSNPKYFQSNLSVWVNEDGSNTIDHLLVNFTFLDPKSKSKGITTLNGLPTGYLSFHYTDNSGRQYILKYLKTDKDQDGITDYYVITNDNEDYNVVTVEKYNKPFKTQGKQYGYNISLLFYYTQQLDNPKYRTVFLSNKI